MRQVAQVMVKSHIRHEWLRERFGVDMSQYQARIINPVVVNGLGHCDVIFENLDTGATIAVNGVVFKDESSNTPVLDIGSITLNTKA